MSLTIVNHDRTQKVFVAQDVSERAARAKAQEMAEEWGQAYLYENEGDEADEELIGRFEMSDN